MSIQNVSVAVVCNFCKHKVQAQTVSPKVWTVLLNDVTFYVISRHWFINRFVFTSDFDSFKTWILQNAQRFGSGCRRI